MEAEQVNSQVRVQLSTPQPDIVLPERSRRILVNTSRLLTYLAKTPNLQA